jgi:DNA-binding cell septation regulator SpoVG
MSKRAQSLFCPDCTRELLRQQQDGEQIRVTEIRRVSDRGALKAYVAVEVGPWTIRGCRIVQQQGQAPYVSLPQEKTGGRYFPILTTKDTRLKQTLRAAVLLEWGRGIEDDDTEN